MTCTAADLFELLPEVYRVRDAEQGGALAGLLAVIAEQLSVVDADVSQLYDDWFIETCQEWLAPYIGDLVGVTSPSQLQPGSASLRAFVAHTLHYRRAKGTVAVLEQLARDLTGWGARAVEYFGLLGTTQYAKHVRLGNVATPDLRDTARLAWLGSPFDTVPRTLEVRTPDAGGRWNLAHVGIHLWRLQSYPLRAVTPRPAPGRPLAWWFSPLGRDLHLFDPAGDAPAAGRLAGPRDVGDALRRRPLFDELTASHLAAAGGGQQPAPYWFDPARPVFGVRLASGSAVDAADLSVCDLGAWTPPAAGLAVDPVLGRLVAADAAFAPVAVDYAYGFSGDLGGGPYDRRAGLACWYDPRARPPTWLAGVSAAAAATSTDPYPSVVAAVAAWNAVVAQGGAPYGIIAVEDSASYDLAGLAEIQVPAGARLAIVAAGRVPALPGELDPAGRRPHLRGDLQVVGTAPAGADQPGELVLDGVLVEGTLTAAPGNLGSLLLSHSTLVPVAGSASVQAAGNPELTVAVCRSITGAVRVTGASGLRMEDAIADGRPAPGRPAAALSCDGPVRIDASTLLGTVDAQTLEAANSLFTQPVSVARRQAGCVRFCHVPAGSLTPRRFRCQPDLAVAAPGAPPEPQVRSRVTPRFTSTDYGDAGYCQLLSGAAAELETGAEDGSEMGAFSFLKRPQRERDLRAALREYLRVGLDVGIFHVT